MRPLLLLLLFTAAAPVSAQRVPVIPVGLDAYREWARWPYQRIGARAYMRSTYDRAGNNERADASHFLYQESDSFNVTLDVEGAGILYFARYNHWHGSPWHYEVDGTDHLVRETSTADPTRPAPNSVFLPDSLFPNPLTWTWSVTKGADLMWVPIPFERSFRMAYGRTFYGTGYYIYHHYVPGAPLSRPIRAWDGRTPPDPDVLGLIRRAGTDLAPPGLQAHGGRVRLDRPAVPLFDLRDGPATVRALELTLPRDRAVELGRARLRITWDGRARPSVDAPLALFFGAGTLYNRDDREYLVRGFPVHVRFDSARVHLACFFPMPYFRAARVELAGIDPAWGAEIEALLRTEPYTDPPNHVGYFHATYRDHPAPVPGEDLVLLDTREAEGSRDWSGSFVGTSFIFSHDAVLNTLEGDPRFFFDDSRSPQAYGTGTEEWAGGGDYWGGRNMTLPFAGHPTGAPRREEARHPEDLIQSAYRFLLADLMPFGRNAVIRLEHGGVNESREHYETVTYWYGLPGASLVLTDELHVGDFDSEAAHAYASPEASPPVTVVSRFEWGPDSIHAHGAGRPRADPRDRVEFEFEADSGRTYFLWVRGRSLARNNRSDAFWVQFDDDAGTERFPPETAPYGVGNWTDDDLRTDYGWSSLRPGDPPLAVRFARSGRHRMRLQPRQPGHRVDQIWLSTSQRERPAHALPVRRPPPAVPGRIREIVLDALDALRPAGAVRSVPDSAVWAGRALQMESSMIEVYPAHAETGRFTTGTSEFNVQLRPDNEGVLLRRTLDYAFPDQRAEVYVADVSDGRADGLRWERAGVWYLAGSNTSVFSSPPDELGATRHVVQTSDRRFREDEFLLPLALTRGRTDLRLRFVFTPIHRPLFPGLPPEPSAWSEIRYQVYCFKPVDFRP